MDTDVVFETSYPGITVVIIDRNSRTRDFGDATVDIYEVQYVDSTTGMVVVQGLVADIGDCCFRPIRLRGTWLGGSDTESFPEYDEFEVAVAATFPDAA